MTATTGPRRGPYSKTPAVRRRILAACLEVFAERGYSASTMKEVATRAGMSQQGLVHHFGSKEELLTAVLEAHEAFYEDMPQTGDPASITAVVDTAIENMRRPGLVEMHSTLSAEGTSAEHPAHAHYGTRYANLRHYLALAFTTLRSAGRLRSAADPVLLASMLIALIDGLQIQWLYDRDALDVRRAAETFLDEIGADLRTG